MHATGAETYHRFVCGRLPASGSGSCDAACLTDKAKQRSFKKSEVLITTFDFQNRLIRLKDCSLF
jgi:hypothetical protein